jgi:hypothetical protein
MHLIRVYNLESIMTESDDAATRKSILGHCSLETNAGAIARVVIGVVISVGHLPPSIALEQQLLPDT